MLEKIPGYGQGEARILIKIGVSDGVRVRVRVKIWVSDGVRSGGIVGMLAVMASVGLLMRL